MRCPYCHNPELVDETVEVTFSEEEVLAFLKKRKKMLDGLVITGGEPTMHEDLPDFIAQVKDIGLLVKLDTNGTNPRMLRDLIAKGLVDYIAMDMKSPLSKYSQTVSRPVNIEAIRESITLLMKGDVPYEFRTTVVKALLSSEDLDTIGQEIQGAEHYYLQQFIPTKILNPQFRRKVTYTDEELAGFQKQLSKYVTYCEVR